MSDAVLRSTQGRIGILTVNNPPVNALAAAVRDGIKEGVEAFGADPQRVVVVPHGVEPTLGQGAIGERELRDRFDLGAGPVIVLPAVTHPHKGHLFLLRVMAGALTRLSRKLILPEK